MRWKLTSAVLIGLATAASLPLLWRKEERPPLVPYVQTPQAIVDAMVELAEITKDDVVYDLGCGDGRLLITAAKKHGCRGVGIDIDPERVAEARANATASGVGDLVEFREGDVLDADLREATVVLMYLTVTVNTRLVPQFEKMRPGSRIVSHQFNIPKLKPKKAVFPQTETGSSPVYLWVTPLEPALPPGG